MRHSRSGAIRDRLLLLFAPEDGSVRFPLEVAQDTENMVAELLKADTAEGIAAEPFRVAGADDAVQRDAVAVELCDAGVIVICAEEKSSLSAVLCEKQHFIAGECGAGDADVLCLFHSDSPFRV